MLARETYAAAHESAHAAANRVAAKPNATANAKANAFASDRRLVVKRQWSLARYQNQESHFIL